MRQRGGLWGLGTGCPGAWGRGARPPNPGTRGKKSARALRRFTISNFLIRGKHRGRKRNIKIGPYIHVVVKKIMRISGLSARPGARLEFDMDYQVAVVRSENINAPELGGLRRRPHVRSFATGHGLARRFRRGPIRHDAAPRALFVGPAAWRLDGRQIQVRVVSNYPLERVTPSGDGDRARQHRSSNSKRCFEFFFFFFFFFLHSMRKPARRGANAKRQRDSAGVKAGKSGRPANSARRFRNSVQSASRTAEGPA